MYISPLASDALLEGSLPAAWTALLSGNWQWVTNQGLSQTVSPSNTWSSLQYNAVTWPNDQYSMLVNMQTPGEIGPAVRISQADSNGQTYYILYATATRLILAKVYRGTTETTLASAPYTPTAGDTFFIAVQGSSLTGIVTGSTTITLNATDTQIPSGRAGIASGTNPGANPFVQNWSGGSLPYPTFVLPQGPASYGSAFFPIKKWAKFSTIVQTPVALSGEVRVSLTPFPVWMWDYDFKYLVGDAGVSSSGYQYVQGFFMSVLGSANPFLFSDPFDSSVLNMPFGTGAVGSPVPDGTIKAFQLTRALASGFDIVQSVDRNGLLIFVNGTAEPQSVPVPRFSNANLSSVAGGSLAGATYYARITYTTVNGETMAAPEASLAVSANNLLKVASPANMPGVTGWNVYVATSSGAETKQNSTPIAIGTLWTEPTSGLISGSALPVANTCGWSISPTGVVTFNGAPPAAAVLTWSGAFFFLCRFGADQLENFQEKFYELWELSSLKFQSVIQ